MKKYLFSMLAMAAVLFTACTQEEDLRSVVEGDEVEATFTIDVPAGAETRAIGDGTTVSHVACAVYNADDEELTDLRIDDLEITDKKATYKIRLAKGQKYRVAFFAYNKEYNDYAGVYTLTDLKNITINADQLSNIEAHDAFTNYVDVTADESMSPIKKEVILKRPFAQLNLGSLFEDVEAARKSGIVVEKTQVTVTNVYTAFNAFDNEVVPASLVAEKTYTYNVLPTEDLKANDGTYDYLALNYMLVGDLDSEKSLHKVTFQWIAENGYKNEPVTVWDNVPMQRNYRTNILGWLLTNPAEFNIVIDEEFNEPDYLVHSYLPAEIELNDETITFQHLYAENGTTVKGNGTIILDDVSINNPDGAAITLAAGANIKLQILSKVHVEGATSAIVVPADATLAIEGIGEVTRSTANRYGDLTLIGNNGSGIAVDGTTVTVDNLAKLVAKGNGVAAYGIGGMTATVKINNTYVDYVCGGFVQPLFVNDPSYGKSEPEGASAIGGALVEITNSAIKKADGGSKAAAIGNRYWQSTEIVITNSVIEEANGGNASAGIGGSRYASGDAKHSVKIKIDGSTVTANGGQFAAGIGAGYDTYCQTNDANAVNDIVITKSTINAKGGRYGAGIGTGYHSAALTGSIDAESTVNAVAGESREKYTIAQNIGYGVVDAGREFKDADVTFTVAGVVIPSPVHYASIARVSNLEELQAALDAAKSGENCIIFAADIAGDAIARQEEGKNITVDGDGKNYNGTIYIYGNARHDKPETLDIKNVNFVATETRDFISCNETSAEKRYAHNVTVENCTFTGLDDADVVGMRFRQCYNITVKDCEATKLHSLMWATGGDHFTVDGVAVDESKNGVSFGTTDNVVVANSEIVSVGEYGYAVRVDANGARSAVVSNSVLKASCPVLVRKATDAYTMALAGNTVEKTGDYHVIVTASDYEEGVALTLPTGEYTLTGADGLVVFAEPVAKVGDIKYGAIGEAIAAWTNNTTLTLLDDVTLSDVITVKSTEHHILDLGTYTMTAASGKNVIEIIAAGTGDAERYAITIKADAANPGGIDAGKKSVVYYDYSKGTTTGNDRPIIKIEGGVFTASTSLGTAGIYAKGAAARKCATFNISGGTFNCSVLGTGKSKMLISGGIFHYSVGSQGDSTCYRLISGGTFKSFGFMTADAANKFGIGTALSNYNVGVYVDDNGYLVVGGPVITEYGDKFAAKATNYSKWSSYLKYSSAEANGLYYTNAELAIKKHGEANVELAE